MNPPAILPFLGLFLLIPHFSLSQHWQTEQITPLPESISNNAVAAGEINGQTYLYTFGGIDSTKAYSGIHRRSYRYDLVLENWEAIADLPDTLGKIAASANRVKDIIYIIGGYHVFVNGNEKSSNRVHRYDIHNNQFISDGTPIPVPIDDQVQAVWRDSLIYVVSGWSETRNVFNVQIYNPATNQWSVGTPLPNGSYPAFGATGEILGDTIYFYGGARSTGGFPISALFRKGLINPDNPTEIEWSISLVPDSEVGYRAGAAVSGGQVYWIGGSEQTYNFDGLAYNNNQGVPPANRSLRYDPATDSWDADRSNVLPMDLRNVAQINDSTIFLIGGMIADQMVSSRVLKLAANKVITSTNNPAKKAIEVLVFPNPVKSQLQIQLKGMSDKAKTLLVYNTNGQVVFSQQINSEITNIRTEGWAKGLYIIQIMQGVQQWSKKVLVD